MLILNILEDHSRYFILENIVNFSRSSVTLVSRYVVFYLVEAVDCSM